MPRDVKLKEIQKFKGGAPVGLDGNLNEIVEVVNALVRESQPNSGKSKGSGGAAVIVYATVFNEETQQVTLRQLTINDAVLGAEVTT